MKIPPTDELEKAARIAYRILSDEIKAPRDWGRDPGAPEGLSNLSVDVGTNRAARMLIEANFSDLSDFQKEVVYNVIDQAVEKIESPLYDDPVKFVENEGIWFS